jgi:hypothetical protein
MWCASMHIGNIPSWLIPPWLLQTHYSTYIFNQQISFCINHVFSASQRIPTEVQPHIGFPIEPCFMHILTFQPISFISRLSNRAIRYLYLGFPTPRTFNQSCRTSCDAYQQMSTGANGIWGAGGMHKFRSLSVNYWTTTCAWLITKKQEYINPQKRFTVV